jgi:hypothetical protein
MAYARWFLADLISSKGRERLIKAIRSREAKKLVPPLTCKQQVYVLLSGWVHPSGPEARKHPVGQRGTRRGCRLRPL